MTGIAENVPATFEDFRRFSEGLRTLPKMSEAFEHFRSYLKDNNLNMFWFRLDTKSSFSTFFRMFLWKLNWISVRTILEVVLDAWDRCLCSIGGDSHKKCESDRLRFQIVSAFVKKRPQPPPPPPPMKKSVILEGGGRGWGYKMECPSSYLKIGCSTPS